MKWTVPPTHSVLWPLPFRVRLGLDRLVKVSRLRASPGPVSVAEPGSDTVKVALGVPVIWTIPGLGVTWLTGKMLADALVLPSVLTRNVPAPCTTTAPKLKAWLTLVARAFHTMADAVKPTAVEDWSAVSSWTRRFMSPL